MKALIGSILTRLHGREKYNLLWILVRCKWLKGMNSKNQLGDIADKVDTYVEVSTPSPA